MPSKRKVASVVGRGSQKGSSLGREQELAVVEIDATFGRMLGLTDGQRVGMKVVFWRYCSSLWNIDRSAPSPGSAFGAHGQYRALNAWRLGE